VESGVCERFVHGLLRRLAAHVPPLCVLYNVGCADLCACGHPVAMPCVACTKSVLHVSLSVHTPPLLLGCLVEDTQRGKGVGVVWLVTTLCSSMYVSLDRYSLTGCDQYDSCSLIVPVWWTLPSPAPTRAGALCLVSRPAYTNRRIGGFRGWVGGGRVARRYPCELAATYRVPGGPDPLLPELPPACRWLVSSALLRPPSIPQCSTSHTTRSDGTEGCRSV